MVKTCVQRIASSEILFVGQRESNNKLAQSTPTALPETPTTGAHRAVHSLDIVLPRWISVHSP